MQEEAGPGGGGPVIITIITPILFSFCEQGSADARSYPGADIQGSSPGL